MARRSLLVPHDFTSVGDNALDYSIKLGLALEANIDLLHVVKSEGDTAKAKTKCEQIISNVKNKPAEVEINYHIRSGTIFTDIASMAAELKSAVIIMGTHGARGMQKLFGSFAIKVIKSTFVPFLVVQENYSGSDFSKILIPLDESQESLQIEQATSGIAEILGAEVHIVTKKHSDHNLKLKNAVHSGLISKQFKSNDLPYVTAVLEGKQYDKMIENYAIENKIDLIAFAYHTDSFLPQFDTFAQHLLTNDSGVPVLVVNSKEAGNYFF